MQFNGLVEFRRGGLLHELHRFLRSVELAALNQLRGILVFLTKFCHCVFSFRGHSGQNALPQRAS